MTTWNEQFQQELLQWYAAGKRVLPWRESRDPFAVWVSEIMLQQTRVEAVIPYFARFMQAFPTVEALAQAEQEEVLKLWEGLGYYSRARHLHQAAKIVAAEYGGTVPDEYESLRRLPGIGDYTAGAVLSIAFNQPYAAVDGNVKRVFSRIFAIPDDVRQREVKSRIGKLAHGLIPPGCASDFNQALMELGALVCIPAAPRCPTCPVQGLCAALAEGDPARYPVKGAPREPLAVVRLVAVVRRAEADGERFLLVQNPPEGMLAGLWGFPGMDLAPAEWYGSEMERRLQREESGRQLSLLEGTVECPDSCRSEEEIRGRLRAELGRMTGWEISVGDVIGVTEFTFTHRAWTMPLLACESTGGPETQGERKAIWVRPEEFAQYAIPTVYQKVIRKVWGKR